MANKDLPYGFRAVRHLSGSPWNGQTMKAYGSSTITVNTYIGDPLLYDGDSCARGCCPKIALVATGQTVEMVGAAASFTTEHGNPLGDNAVPDGLPYRRAYTAKYVNVVIDPDVIFQIQGDSTAAINIADVGSNIEMIATAHTGAAALGLSPYELKGGSAVQDKTEQIWLMGKVDRPDNDITLVNADWYVLFNTHKLLRMSSGVLGNVLGI